MSWGDPSAFGFLVLLGCASGFISGLLGVGGGTILVPTQLLCALFVVFALYTAWGLMQRCNARHALGTQIRAQPGLIRITATGVLGGAFASLLGLGVAFFSVPIRHGGGLVHPDGAGRCGGLSAGRYAE